MWGNTNRQGFLDWVYKTFNHEKREVTPLGQLFPHQMFVRDFMEFNSPYRGLLIYHGLGSGKTASSIAAAEGFINKNKKIIVMLPASLEMNYRDEIMKHASSGNPQKRLWSFIEIKKVATKQGDAAVALDVSPGFLKKNPKIWFPFSEGIPPGAIVRKDVAWTDLNDAEKKLATNTLKEIINKNYHFIRYNGLTQTIIGKYTKDFFNDSFIIIDEVHNFISQVVNGSKFARNLYTKIMDATNIKLVLLSGTPVINHPFELSITLNLVRGYMNVYEFSLLKGAELPTHQELTDLLGDNKYIDQYFMLQSEKKIMVTLVPEGYINDGNGILENTEEVKSSEEIIKDLYQEINKTIKVSKRVPIKEMFALPNNREQFNTLFLDETDRENPVVRHTDLFKRRTIGTVSFVKSLGQEVYPTILPKVIEQVPLSDHQFSKYLIVRDEERMMERRSRMNKGGLMAKKTSVYRAFSRMACNFVFPNNIDRPYPKDLRKMLQNEIDRNEDDEAESEEGEAKIKGKIDKVKLKKDYEDIMKLALKKVAEDKSLLSLDNLRALYSPKFAKIIDLIHASPGKSLVYSQFRSIEGIGVLRLALIANGFIEVQIEKKSKADDTVLWRIMNAEEVLDPKYDGKRFIVFDTDREKANILLQLYNGIYNNIETDITLRPNLRGEMFRTFMITQSGAEGISLKNVRTVLITEPFWNSVRIDQVIGRAARAASHIELPKDEQNISVHIFVATFTRKQLKDNFSLRSLDNELTSDAHILQIAQKKDDVIQTFLNSLKTAAVDCRTNAYLNKTGLACYSFPIPIQADDYAYVPDINIDQEPNTKRIVRQRKIRGKVITENGKKYVIVDDYPAKRFSYVLYKDAGILQED